MQNQEWPISWGKIVRIMPSQDGWLNLPKDVWRLICTMTLVSGTIGYIDIQQIVRLRSSCRYFANLITPHFCLKVIFINPATNNFAYTCGLCTKDASYQTWRCGEKRCNKHHRTQNEYCGLGDKYHTKKYIWSHNPESFVADRSKPSCVIRRPIFRKTKPIKQAPPRYCTETYLDKRGTSNPQKIDMEKYYKSRKANNPKQSHSNVPRSTCNRRKDKFWKKKEFDDNYDRY